MARRGERPGGDPHATLGDGQPVHGGVDVDLSCSLGDGVDPDQVA